MFALNAPIAYRVTVDDALMAYVETHEENELPLTVASALSSALATGLLKGFQVTCWYDAYRQAFGIKAGRALSQDSAIGYLPDEPLTEGDHRRAVDQLLQVVANIKQEFVARDDGHLPKAKEIAQTLRTQSVRLADTKMADTTLKLVRMISTPALHYDDPHVIRRVMTMLDKINAEEAAELEALAIIEQTLRRRSDHGQETPAGSEATSPEAGTPGSR